MDRNTQSGIEPGDGPRSGRGSFWALAVLILAGALANALSFRGYTIDDPWITYRYADNLAAGNGLVFNPGDRLESYSSLTHVLILAGVRLAGFDLDLPSRLLGFFAHAAAVALLLAAGWRAGGDRPVVFRVLAAGFLAFSFPAAAWAVGGLETSLAGFVILAAVLAYAREETRETGFRWSAVLLFLVATTRVEGVLVFFCLAALRAWKWWVEGGPVTRRTVQWTATFAALFGAYTAWRWAWFGDLLPNTYYAKASGPLAEQLREGAIYCLGFALYGGVLPLVFCAMPLVFRESRERAVPGLFAIGGYTAFVLYCGGDWMPFYRFFVHVLPLGCWLFQEGAWTVYENASKAAPSRRTQAGLLVAVAVLAAVAGNFVFLIREAGPIMGCVRRGTLIGQYFEVADYLKQAGRPDQLLAGSEAGVLPYVSGMRFLDIVGVLDRHIARTPGRLHRKSDPDYVLSKAPDWIVLHALPERKDGEWIGLTPAANDLLRHPRFRAQYTLERTFVRGDEVVGKDLFLVFRNKEPAKSK